MLIALWPPFLQQLARERGIYKVYTKIYIQPNHVYELVVGAELQLALEKAKVF